MEGSQDSVESRGDVGHLIDVEHMRPSRIFPLSDDSTTEKRLR
jgi:hypothetical protein